MSLDYSRLEGYFSRCILDAYKSENKKFDEKRCKCFFLVIGNAFIPYIYTPYSRVSRRIRYRLENNIQGNFGLVMGQEYFFETELPVNFVASWIIRVLKLIYVVFMRNIWIGWVRSFRAIGMRNYVVPIMV